MFIISIKQIIRRPIKAWIFFLLITSATALLVFATINLIETNQMLAAVEEQFTTIATVTQAPEAGDELLQAELFNFEGAEYLSSPETRPHFLAYNPDIYTSDCLSSGDSISIVEFTPLEDCTGLNQVVKIQIETVHCNKVDAYRHYMGLEAEKPESGDRVSMFQLFQPFVTLEKGQTYIANLTYIQGQRIGFPNGYIPYFNPFSTSFVADSQPRLDKLTDDFWEEGRKGQVWLEWIKIHRRESIYQPGRHSGGFPVLLTDNLNLLPTFHSKKAYISSGRSISQDEFDTGAKVCVLPQRLLSLNGLKVGDKINLSMVCAMYGFTPEFFQTFQFNCGFYYSAVDSNGTVAQPFFEADYEIVGEYAQTSEGYNELYYDMIIIPSKSINQCWEDKIAYAGPMNRWSTSFQIPNGRISQFDEALHMAVPETSMLQIVYDDNGYNDVVNSLKNAHLSSFLLLLISFFTSITVIVLLLYFFVIKEKKRTAIERSLGLSKASCRASLLVGIIVLTLPAVALGSGAAWILRNKEIISESFQPGVEENGSAASAEWQNQNASNDSMIEEADQSPLFCRDFSLWAENDETSKNILLDGNAHYIQNSIYALAPISIFFLIVSLTIIMVNNNLRIEPIMLLGGQSEQ